MPAEPKSPNDLPLPPTDDAVPREVVSTPVQDAADRERAVEDDTLGLE